jgi:hypothetical protein
MAKAFVLSLAKQRAPKFRMVYHFLPQNALLAIMLDYITNTVFSDHPSHQSYQEGVKPTALRQYVSLSSLM